MELMQTLDDAWNAQDGDDSPFKLALTLMSWLGVRDGIRNWLLTAA